MNKFRKVLSLFLVLMFILSGLPAEIKAFAADSEDSGTLSVEYNANERKYEISYPMTTVPGRVEVKYHDPENIEEPITIISTGVGSDTYIHDGKKVIVRTTLKPDHIYDISMDIYRKAEGDDLIVHKEIYYLAGMTFNGESFNLMADDNNGIVDDNPESSATSITSGSEPKIRLSWKIPTIYCDDGIIYLTDSGATDLLEAENIDINEVYFQINTEETRDRIKRSFEFRGGLLDIDDDGIVSVELGKDQNIKPGTEYLNTKIGVIFKNNASPDPVTINKLSTGDGDNFKVENKDRVVNPLYKYNGAADKSSIYTPIKMIINKVDVDKIEVKFDQMTGKYPNHYYQVQYVDNMLNFSETDKWVKIKSDSLTEGEAVNEVVTIPITDDNNQYIRVAFFLGASNMALNSSLAINIKNLSVDSSKPPLPKVSEVKAEYKRKGDVDVDNPIESEPGKVEIPINDLTLVLEKPLEWKNNDDWDNFKDDQNDSDIIFHVILSSLLPDSEIKNSTTEIGLSEKKKIYLPEMQKRVLVLTKKQFDEYTDEKGKKDPNKIVCTIAGDKLFYDYARNEDIPNENNLDLNGNGTGDYPNFLIPNTVYYMQIFSSRLSDNNDIFEDLWADGFEQGLDEKISYMSPIISFTTLPLTDAPIPMPVFKEIELEYDIDSISGDMIFSGISVKYLRLLIDEELRRYTGDDKDRKIRYQTYISRNPDSFSENAVITVEVPYPETPERLEIPILIEAEKEGLLPNTVYYIKANASIWINDGEVSGWRNSQDTAIKAITTPKIEDGGLDNDDTNPRAPVSFDIDKDNNGDQIVSDNSVTFDWNHTEDDVIYEMVCTTVPISTEDKEEGELGYYDYKNDALNKRFRESYYNEFGISESERRDTLYLDVNSFGSNPYERFYLSDEGHVVMPIDWSFLVPNNIYYFSLRAVRKSPVDEPTEKVSIWITVPVTTRMIKPPAYIEAVKDMEIGFNINADERANVDDMELYIRKSDSDDTNYVKLNRAEYTCVKDKDILYFRIYNLESNQWYDVHIKDKSNESWYDKSTNKWTKVKETPIKEKTRDALKEIEVRWEGQEPYDYLLEIKAEKDSKYQQLYFKNTGKTDYGYDILGGRIDFYREKTRLYVEEDSEKYIYYAKISGTSISDINGNLSDHKDLDSNTSYYVKLWASNQYGDSVYESLRIGPAITRTDFSQDDYDEQKKEDSTIDIFNESADRLTQKLYWLIDIRDNTNVRVLLKDDRIEGLLKLSRGSTVTVDLSAEKSNASYYEVLIPYKTLEAIDIYDSRLNIKVNGAEFTLNKGSIDLPTLKAQTLTGASNESMLLLKITKRQNPKNTLPSGVKHISDAYELQTIGIGSNRTYAEINQMIYDILENSDTKGPFKYGILDRELTIVLNDLAKHSYRSHTDLKDLINSAINKAEVEMSRYLKDIIDGGSGISKSLAVTKGINQFSNKMGIKLEYKYHNGYMTPFVNYGSGFKEPVGSKGYVMQYVLFRVESPGEYVIIGKGQVVTDEGIPDGQNILPLSLKYDLTKAFGQGTIYTANPIKGEEALMLYALVTSQESRVTGLTPVQKASTLGLGDIIDRSVLTGYMDNQSSISLAVKLYCTRANINPDYMKPSKTITILNGKEIKQRLYSYVVLGIDLEIIKLGDNSFDSKGRTTIGDMLDMLSKALEKFD